VRERSLCYQPAPSSSLPSVWPIDLVDDMGQHLVWQYDHRPSWNGLAT
jgi:hypothetical protein